MTTKRVAGTDKRHVPARQPAARKRSGPTRAVKPGEIASGSKERFFGKHLFERAKVSSKGWIVIPKEIRDEMDLRPGDEVALALWPPLPNMKQDRRLYTLNVVRVPANPVELMTGMFKGRPGEPPITQTLIEARLKERDREERELRRPRRKRGMSA